MRARELVRAAAAADSSLFHFSISLSPVLFTLHSANYPHQALKGGYFVFVWRVDGSAWFGSVRGGILGGILGGIARAGFPHRESALPDPLSYHRESSLPDPLNCWNRGSN